MQAEWFGPYRLEKLIGRGGMGEVFQATDTVRKRTVALKRLPAGLAADPSYQRRFRYESEIAARLRSAHVIPIHDYGEIDGRLYIDMRLVNGEDVTDRLTRRGPMTPAVAVDLIHQTASALDAAHAMKLIHRDVKPSNILLSPEDGRDGFDFVYLVDFGIARATDRTSEFTGTNAVMGTPDYMAPERFEGHAIDHTVDVYSLACVLHKLLTGHTPFPRDSLAAVMYAHLTAIPPRASLRRRGIPAGLDWVIARGMSKDPRERFATAGELADAARAALHSTGPTLPPPANTPPRPAASARVPMAGQSRSLTGRFGRGRVAAAAVVAAVAVAGAGTLATRTLLNPGTRGHPHRRGLRRPEVRTRIGEHVRQRSPHPRGRSHRHQAGALRPGPHHHERPVRPAGERGDPRPRGPHGHHHRRPDRRARGRPRRNLGQLRDRRCRLHRRLRQAEGRQHPLPDQPAHRPRHADQLRWRLR